MFHFFSLKSAFLLTNLELQDDDDDDDELFLWYGLASFAAGAIVRDPYHRKSLTHRQQNINLHRP